MWVLLGLGYKPYACLDHLPPGLPPTRGPRASCQRRHPGANPAAPHRGLVPGMILDEWSRVLAWAEPQLQPLPHCACSDLPERASAVASVAVAADVEAASTASSLRRLAPPAGPHHRAPWSPGGSSVCFLP